MVLPLKKMPFGEVLSVIERRGGGYRRTDMEAVAFVPMTGGNGK